MTPERLRWFLAKVVEDEESGCWEWIGYVDRKGRGTTHIDRRTEYVHRLAYEHYVGPLIEGHHIHHKCCNDICVNPDHLQQVTPKEHFSLR